MAMWLIGEGTNLNGVTSDCYDALDEHVVIEPVRPVAHCKFRMEYDYISDLWLPA